MIGSLGISKASFSANESIIKITLVFQIRHLSLNIIIIPTLIGNLLVYRQARKDYLATKKKY